MLKRLLWTVGGMGLAAAAAAQGPAPPLPPLPNVNVRIVGAPPPPPRREVVVYETRPAPESLWIGGYYDWQEEQWGWVPGRWVSRPAPRSSWVRARYVRGDGGWQYVPAHWSNQRVLYEDGRVYDGRAHRVKGPRGKAWGHNRDKKYEKVEKHREKEKKHHGKHAD